MDSSGTVSEVEVSKVRRNHLDARSVWPSSSRWIYAPYAVALLAAISIWFLAIRAPLWLDEVGTYWTIKDGFAQIWLRQYFGPPVYFYIVWLATKILGTSELALRLPSALAMLGALYLLYLAALELFDRETALIATIVFCVHPIVIFESVDVRPYAFAVLLTNAAILAMLGLRHNDSNWLAAVFGLLAAGTLYLHFLYAVILPALVICFFIVKKGDCRAMWRQFGVCTAAFALAFLPLIPGLRFMFHTAGSHVFEAPPRLQDLFYTLAAAWLPFILVGVGLIAPLISAGKEKNQLPNPVESWRVGVCASLALIPLLILYGVSAGTSIHIFVDRHRLVAIPGIALCWGYGVSRFRHPAMRLLFCATAVAAMALFCLRPSVRGHHFDSWKYALEFAQNYASADDAPVVVCSDFPEADYTAMPIESAKSSRFFSQLSYYKLTVPVVPMPRALNDEAMRVGSQFLVEGTEKHQRFLGMAYEPSYKTLDWLAQKAAGAYHVRKLGVFDHVEVLEFVPHAEDSTDANLKAITH